MKPARRPIRDRLLVGSLEDLDSVRLAGSRCAECGEVSLGINCLCPNCGRDGPDGIALGERGTLVTFSAIRHRPPGDYRGPEPFEPFGIGLVDLPEGIGVITPLEGAIESFEIGQTMRLKPHILYVDEDAREVVAFRFAPVA